MNKKDVFSVVKGYLYLWPHLRKGNGAKIHDFVISRKFRIHQNHANVFLNLYCPEIKEEVVGINYRLFLDLIVKYVDDYQNSLLVKRQFEAGKSCEWSNQKRYCQYSSADGRQKFTKSVPSSYFLVQQGLS